MEGLGELLMTRGELYVGEFKNGFPHGHGNRTWPNGNKYIGDFRSGY